MRAPRVLALLFASIVTASLAVPSTSLADADSFPPTVGPVVFGDVSGYQWMLPATNAAAAHQRATGAGVTIGVIDTGVDATHPDVAGRVIPGAIVTKDDDGKPVLVPATVEQTSDDWYGHGSHVAGILAADDDGNGVTGMAPDALLMPIDLEPRRSPIRSSPQFFRMVSAGIDFAATHGADVVNMSLGGPSSGLAPGNDYNERYLKALDTLCASVEAASASGVVVVASAGNEGTWGNPEIKPAACRGAVTVAALSPHFDRTYWSSFDAAVDIAAPGEDILSLDSTVADESLTAHRFASGTSMAAPVVAGTAALVKEQHPDWSAERVANRLTSTAKDIGIPGRDPESGFGIVDAAAAVGAGGPDATKQDFMSTWYQDIYGAKGDGVVISWTPPHITPVLGYTVTVHTDEGVTTYDVDGMTVRTEASLPLGGWWTVTAHLGYSDVTTYPMPRAVNDYDRPPRLKGVHLSRSGDRMHITWDVPDDPTKVDRIRAFVYYNDKPGGGRGAIRVHQDQPFPTGMTVQLRDQGRWLRGRWLDAHVELLQINRDDEGKYLGSRWQSVRRDSPALYGSHVAWIAAAGREKADLEGALSPIRADRVCGTSTCPLERAVVVIRRADRVTRVPVVFNTRGTFHTTVAIGRGQEALTVKVVGPLRLDSGPFVRLPIKP
jgi:subtilisin family serine protease